MLKTFFLLIAFVALLIFCTDLSEYSSSKTDDMEKWELFGSVKFVEDEYYFPKEKMKPADTIGLNLEQDFRLSAKQHLFFHKEGRLTEQKYFGSQSISWHMVYNARGYIDKGYYYDAEGKVRLESKIKLDDDKNQVEETFYKIDGSISRSKVITYNDLNQKISTESVTKNGRGSRFNYTYDRNGREIGRETFMKGAKFSRNAKTYDKTGRLSTWKAYDENDDMLWEISYAYSGNKMTRSVKTDYSNDSKLDMQYNDYGFVSISTKSQKKDGGSEVSEDKLYYKYDDQGNWLQKIRFYNGELTALDTRRIEYY